ncbi:MAG: hypothetical protein ACYTX0_09225 [Nostoc sp.]
MRSDALSSSAELPVTPGVRVASRREGLEVRKIFLISPRMMSEIGQKPDRFSYQRVKTG